MLVLLEKLLPISYRLTKPRLSRAERKKITDLKLQLFLAWAILFVTKR